MGQKDQSEQERLEAEHRGKALDKPDLEETPGLGVWSAINISHEIPVGNESQEQENDEWGANKGEQKGHRRREKDTQNACTHPERGVVRSRVDCLRKCHGSEYASQVKE